MNSNSNKTFLKGLFEKSLVYYLWREFWIRWYFKFVLPKMTRITLEDLHFDVSSLPLKARHRLLNVGYEVAEKEMCREYLKPDDSVIELGAAIGFIGLFCQKKLGIRDYLLFEANPRSFELLKRNYALNGLTPAAWNVAFGPDDGEVELEIGGDFWEHSIVQAIDPRQGRKTMAVPAEAWNTLLGHVTRPVTALIIDIEGAEQFIDPKQIPGTVTKLIIELHPRLIGVEKTYELIAGIIGQGFRAAREENGIVAFLRNAEAPAHDAMNSEQASSPRQVRFLAPRRGVQPTETPAGIYAAHRSI